MYDGDPPIPPPPTTNTDVAKAASLKALKRTLVAFAVTAAGAASALILDPSILGFVQAHPKLLLAWPFVVYAAHATQDYLAHRQ